MKIGFFALNSLIILNGAPVISQKPDSVRDRADRSQTDKGSEKAIEASKKIYVLLFSFSGSISVKNDF